MAMTLLVLLVQEAQGTPLPTPGRLLALAGMAFLALIVPKQHLEVAAVQDLRDRMPFPEILLKRLCNSMIGR